MEKPVLCEYYVIDFYALYLVIRMPASWHVFADPVTFTECRKWMNWASVALTMEYKKILESKEEWLDDSLITGQKLRAQVWLINKFACMCVCGSKCGHTEFPRINAALRIIATLE